MLQARQAYWQLAKLVRQLHFTSRHNVKLTTLACHRRHRYLTAGAEYAALESERQELMEAVSGMLVRCRGAAKGGLTAQQLTAAVQPRCQALLSYDHIARVRSK